MGLRRWGSLGVITAACAVAAVGVTAQEKAPRGPAAVAAPHTAAGLRPVVVTISGLDGHGTPTATVSSATTLPSRAAVPPMPATRPTRAATPVSEGLSVRQVTGSARTGQAQPHVATPQTVTSIGSGLDLAVGSASVFTAGGMRYISLNLRVRNAQSCSSPGTCAAYTAATHNLTLMAAVTSASISQTAVSKIKLFDGTNGNASIATQIVPTDGVTNGPDGKAVPVAGDESLQVYSEAETAAMPTVSGESLLPYGFVVRNPSTPSSRSLPGSPPAGDYEGLVTIAVAFPVQTPATANPFSISLLTQPVDDTNTRVTQAREDDDAHGDLTANARASTLGSTDLAVLGNGHTTSTNLGDPICTVRTAGTAASPTAYLVNDGGGANVASLPYNLSALSPTAAIRAGFCQSMTTGSGTFSAFVVAGSESGLRTNSGRYSGTFTGGSVVSFQPGQAFFTGERVSVSVTAGLTSTSGAHPQAFVGTSYAGGAARSAGAFAQATSTATGASPVAEAVGDFDGDGIPDVATVNSGANTVSVFFGHGDGTFSPPETLLTGSDPLAIAAGDLNQDGLSDLVVANSSDSTVSVFLAGPGRTFTQPAGSPYTTNIGTTPSQYQLGRRPVAIAAADLNGDGIPEVVTVNAEDDNLSIFTQSGNGVLGDSPRHVDTGLVGPQSVAVLDWNGDGIPDFAVSDGLAANVLEASAGSYTQVADFTTAASSTGGTLAVGDFNGDGHPDVAEVVSGAAAGSPSVTVGYGNGSTFTSTQTITTPSYGNPVGIAAITDSPGASQDLAVSYDTGNVVQLFTNPTRAGTSSWAAGATNSTPAGPQGITVADLNGDSTSDLVTVGGTANELAVALGDGAGNLGPGPVAPAQHALPAVPYHPNGEAVGDFNGDGHLDVAIVAGAPANTLRVDLGGPAGSFSPGTTVTANLSNPFAVYAADFDGDGLLDLAVVNAGNKTVSFYKGDGTGNFSARGTVTVGTQPEQAVVGDFNGDGRPDLAVTNAGGGGVSILLNTGTFGFTTSTLSVATTSANGIDIGDLNADGHLDLAIADASAGQVDIELGDGTGTFTFGGTVTTGGTLDGVALADLNGDGLPDIAALDSGGRLLSAYALPQGGFAPPVAYAVGGEPKSLAIGDINGDGTLDVVVASYSTTLNQGYATVLDGTPAGLALPLHPRVDLTGNPSSLVLGDFLGDHELALLTTSYSASTGDLAVQRS